MSKPKTIPSAFISSVPATDDVDSVRPGIDKKWTVAKDSKPEIIIALVPAGEEGVLLGRLVTKGDMPGVTVFVKNSENDDFKPVSTSKDGQPKVRIYHGIFCNANFFKLKISHTNGELNV